MTDAPIGPSRLRSRSGTLSAATAVVGVIGDPVAHSLSPLLHNTAFTELGLDWVSVGFPVEAGAAAVAVDGARALGVRGLSVTMPHKEAVVGVAEGTSTVVDRLGAANCLVARGGSWFADNTDGPGLVAALRRGDRFDPAGARCLVVGAGGAARAVILGLAEAEAAEIIVVNRSAGRTATAALLAPGVARPGTAEEATGCDLVVNATPLGMDGAGAGGSGGWPVDPALLTAHQVVVDLVYHPRVSPWLEAARGRGAQVANGIGMLVHQAALQLAAWTGVDAPVDAMWRAVADVSVEPAHGSRRGKWAGGRG